MGKVRFHYENLKFRLTQSRNIQAWVEKTALSEKKHILSLDYIFCTDEALYERNLQFLNHDTYTDIITFDLSESTGQIIGEIYISIDRVKDNSLRFEQSFDDELHRVIIHGLLHLCGYGDKKKAEKEKMRTLEDRYLKKRNW